MPLPEPGRYGVVRTGGVVSWLIRRATRSWANHAFIVGDNATVIEAGTHGVRAARPGMQPYTGHLAEAARQPRRIRRL